MAYTTIDNPKIFQNSIIYTGNDGTRNITEADTFQADLVWLKRRNDASSHYWVDSVRGATKSLSSNSDTLEATESAGVTGFVTDGFSLGGQGGYNNNGDTFVSWLWKAGTTGSGTTTGAGTGKAYSYSVNTTSGFSIVKYIGNLTAAHTIPHHLGVAPKMVICKSISENRGWPIQHASLTSAAYSLFLSTTGAQANGSNSWNSTAASSSVVTLGNNESNNKNDDSYIMYSFAEKQGYSKFSSYIGNGNVNGTFVYTGFKPAFVLIKRAIGDAGEGWSIFDTARSPFNKMVNELRADVASAEATSNHTMEFYSNGFKIPRAGGGINTSGDTLIYMAFAEQPFVTSTGIPATAR